MPARRYFIVKQEREVKISAPTALDAAKCAADLFLGVKPPDGGPASVQSPITERALHIEEER